MYNPCPPLPSANQGNTPVQPFQATPAPQGGGFLGGLAGGLGTGALMAQLLKKEKPSEIDYTQGMSADMQPPQNGVMPPQGMPQQQIGQYTVNPNLQQMAQSPSGNMQRMPNGNYMYGSR